MKSFFKYASLLAAAVMLLSCEKDNNDQNGGTDTPGAGVFKLVADKDVIQSNGTDATTLTVYLDGVDVTAESVIYNDAKEVVTLNEGKFTASKDGEYKFWA